MKKYKLKKQKFINYMFSEIDDLNYWSQIWLSDFKSNYKIDFTVQELFDSTVELPLYIMEGHENNLDDYTEELDKIKLID